MMQPPEVPTWAALLTCILVLLGAGLTLIGSDWPIAVQNFL